MKVTVSLGYCDRLDRNHRAVLLTFFEYHDAICEGIQGMVAANAYVHAWVVSSTTLTHDDVASYHLLTTVQFNA